MKRKPKLYCSGKIQKILRDLRNDRQLKTLSTQILNVKIELVALRNI